MGLRSGLNPERMQRLDVGSQTGFIRKLQTLVKADGDTVQFRILSADSPEARQRDQLTADPVCAGNFHMVPGQSPAGKPFWQEVECEKEEADDYTPYGPCQYCDHPDKNVSRVNFTLVMWVFVRSVLHRTNPTGADWPQVTRGRQAYFEEVCNEPMIWMARRRDQKDAVLAKLNRYDSLTDRDYEMQRSGTGMDNTAYMLESLDPQPMEPDLRELALPALPDVVAGRVERLDGGGESPAPQYEAVPLKRDSAGVVPPPRASFTPLDPMPDSDQYRGDI